MKKKGMGKLFAGVAIGTGLGMLFAPKKGSDTRVDLKNKIDELLKKAKETDLNEVRENIEKKIDEITKEMKELDKEKVLEIAKKQAESIKVKTGELVEYAKEKGTPVLEKTTESVREKAIKVTKEVLNKLEKSEKETK